MKNRTVLARLAALGMSIMLCFGVVACGEEKDSSERSRTEKDADADEDKEDDEKEDEEKKEEDEKDSTDDKKEGTSGKDEARNGSKEDTGAASGKEERAASISDGKVAGHYVSTVDLGEDYFLEQMGTGDVGDVADLFKGADFSFEATLDLKDDGTGVLGFDLETFYGNMYDFMDAHYIDMMRGAFTSMGFSDEELKDLLKDSGYSSIDEALEDYKREAMEEFDRQMRENSKDAANSTIELTWEEDGDTVHLINDEGGIVSVDRGSDGRLTMALEEDQSPTGTAMELVFVK